MWENITSNIFQEAADVETEGSLLSELWDAAV